MVRVEGWGWWWGVELSRRPAHAHFPSNSNPSVFAPCGPPQPVAACGSARVGYRRRRRRCVTYFAFFPACRHGGATESRSTASPALLYLPLTPRARRLCHTPPVQSRNYDAFASHPHHWNNTWGGQGGQGGQGAGFLLNMT